MTWKVVKNKVVAEGLTDKKQATKWAEENVGESKTHTFTVLCEGCYSKSQKGCECKEE